jgi:hypothetical protein
MFWEQSIEAFYPPEATVCAPFRSPSRLLELSPTAAAIAKHCWLLVKEKKVALYGATTHDLVDQSAECGPRISTFWQISAHVSLIFWGQWSFGSVAKYCLLLCRLRSAEKKRLSAVIEIQHAFPFAFVLVSWVPGCK